MTKRLTLGIGGVALLAGSLVYIGPAIAQVPPLAFELLAGGRSPGRIRINAKAPSDVLQTKLVFQPGADTGWHKHPGYVIAVVKSGALTEFHDNGCVSVHAAGSVFLEEPGEAHKAINQSGVVVEAIATFIVPAGTQPQDLLQPVPDPGSRPCRPGRGDDDDRD
jgi:quercetin dioxygenase-like cupin family protein